MKRKALFFSISCVLASTMIAVSCILVNQHNNRLDKTKGDDDFYTITINPEDVTDAISYVNGVFQVRTDQLDNPINLQFEQVFRVTEPQDAIYLGSNGVGKIFNYIGTNSEIRGMNSIIIKGANDPFTVKWGWADGEEIVYEDKTWDYARPEGTEFSFNNEKPNYFLIESGNKYPDMIYQIIIKYGRECEAGTDPYAQVGKMKYKRHGDVYWCEGFINESDPENPTTLTFPSTIKGLPVTVLNGFGSNYDIETLDLRDSNINELWTYSFSNCTSLETILGFEQITSFRNSCLQGTKIGGTLEFSDGLMILEGSAFYGCDDIGHVIFSDLCTPTSIDNGAFNWCEGVKTCRLGKNFNGGYPEFYGDMVLESYITAEDSVYYKAIDGILYRKSGEDLALVQIPTHNATENYVMPNTVCSVDSEFAENCNVLKTFTYNDVVTYSGAEAFEGCTTLEAVTFGANMYELSRSCFRNCSALTTINIPVSVNRIETNVFNGCTSLATFNYAGTVEQWGLITIDGDSWHASCPATKVICTNGEIALS